MFDGTLVHFPQNCGVTWGEFSMTKQGLAHANGKGDNRSRFGEIKVDSIRHARPLLIEAIIKDDDSTLSQSTLAGGEIVRGYFRCVSAIYAN